MRHAVYFERSVIAASRDAFAVRRKCERHHPVRLLGQRLDLCEIFGAEYFDGFVGGALRFSKSGQEYEPLPGRAVIYPHRLLHESTPIVSGVKFAVRTDVMYRAPLLAVWPGLLILIAVAAVNLLGDGLRRALDPRQAVPHQPQG